MVPPKAAGQAADVRRQPCSGPIAGGVLAAAAGIRAPMLAGAVPLVAVTVLLAWRHRARPGTDGAQSAS